MRLWAVSLRQKSSVKFPLRRLPSPLFSPFFTPEAGVAQPSYPSNLAAVIFIAHTHTHREVRFPHSNQILQVWICVCGGQLMPEIPFFFFVALKLFFISSSVLLTTCNSIIVVHGIFCCCLLCHLLPGEHFTLKLLA